MAQSAAGITAIAAIALFLGVTLYLWLIERGMSSTPRDASKLAQKRWTVEDLREGYQKVQKSPTDVKPFLFAKRQRRYIVVGGSGLVGGWIVQHLLLRGEDPAAIRILDLKAPTRPEVAKNNVSFFATDVSDATSVSKAFDAPWDARVAKLPLTIFHTVAYIKPSERKADFMPLYEKINIKGTQNVLDAAKAAGASCFIATSSGSVGVRPINYFFAPWMRMPTDFFQLLGNADPKNPDAPLEDFASCYAYSKIRAERLVCVADDERSGFRTGCIRPGHAIYGHGVDNPSSITYDYLRRGGSPTWIAHIVTNFVDAQNVSIAHLAYENTLLSQPGSSVGGQAYCCTDPNPPVVYGDLYVLLATLAHPMKSASFPKIPSTPMLLLCYFVETYTLLQHRYLKFLPRFTGDLAILQPATLFMSDIHIVYDDSRARNEIGYKAPITTLEGMCHQLVYWNEKVEAQLEKDVAEGKGGEVESSSSNAVPKPPSAH